MGSEGKERLYDAVIFDLDGTLLDTLDDLTNSVNAVLAQHEMRQFTRGEIRSFVGNGIRRLLQSVVPGGDSHPDFERILCEFRNFYERHCMDETEPYPGIIALLTWLQTEGYRVAVVSNKADFAVSKLNRIYFGELVPVAIGEHEGCRRKPAPDSVLLALQELGVDASRAVYVGDSEVDLQTAQNARMACIAVSWGFRSRESLIAHGAQPDRIAANVNEVRTLLLKN